MDFFVIILLSLLFYLDIGLILIGIKAFLFGG